MRTTTWSASDVQDPRQEKVSCSWLNQISPRKMQPLPITNTYVKSQSSPEEHFKANSPGAQGLFASSVLTWSLWASPNVHQWLGGQILVGQSCRVRQVLGQEAQQRHGHGLRMDIKERDTVRPGTSSHASSGRRRKDCHFLILMWALSPGTSAMAQNDASPALDIPLQRPPLQGTAQTTGNPNPPAWECHSFPTKPPFPRHL